MSNFEQALIHRDKLSREEAMRERRRARAEIWEMIENGASYDDVEDFMSSEFGLEMDYIDELI